MEEEGVIRFRLVMILLLGQSIEKIMSKENEVNNKNQLSIFF